MAVLFCIYCDEDIGWEVYQEWADSNFIDNFICPKCGGEMEIDVEMEPTFHAHKPVNNEPK